MAKRKKTHTVARAGRRPGRRPSRKSQSKPKTRSKAKSEPKKPKSKSQSKAKPRSKPKSASLPKTKSKKPRSKPKAKAKSKSKSPSKKKKAPTKKKAPVKKKKAPKAPARPKRKRKKKVEPKPPGEVMWRTVVSRGYIRRTEDAAGERLVYMGEVRATQYFDTEKEARAAVETLTTNINSRLQNIYDISLWSKFQGKEPNVDVSAVSWNEDLIDLGEMVGDYEEEYKEVVH